MSGKKHKKDKKEKKKKDRKSAAHEKARPAVKEKPKAAAPAAAPGKGALGMKPGAPPAKGAQAPKAGAPPAKSTLAPGKPAPGKAAIPRSEERRVGKGGASGWG